MSDRTHKIIEDAADHGIRVYGDAATDEASTDFAMYSPEGNEAVSNAVAAAWLGVQIGGFAWQVKAVLRNMLTEVRKTYPEVGDTMVRETIFARLEDHWVAAYGSTIALEDALS